MTVVYRNVNFHFFESYFYRNSSLPGKAAVRHTIFKKQFTLNLKQKQKPFFKKGFSRKLTKQNEIGPTVKQ